MIDQNKIGKFIAEKRKEKGLTQTELANVLGITDRAISKWENGRCLPDAGLIQDLCKTLGITVNDLFNGEVVDMKENEQKLEEHLLEMTKLKEERDRLLLRMEVVLGYGSTIFFFALLFAITFLNLPEWVRAVLICGAFILYLVPIGYLFRIEQIAGYYECPECHYRYVPSYKSVFFALHMGRTRKMKCPKCHKKAWQKKVIGK